jgi:predicted helicase
VPPTPIEVFDYVYGVLHDPVYCERFDEFMCRDFPRVPIINNETEKDNPDAFFVSEDMFRAYIAAGERLRKLHLMQIKTPTELVVEPNTSDNMEIGAVKYNNGVLHLNASKRIAGISEEIWEYRIGGYQVLDRWFKSHRGETLTIEHFGHICHVAGLLAETIKVRDGLRKRH